MPEWMRDSSVEPPNGVVPTLATSLKEEKKRGNGNETSRRFSLAVPKTADRTVRLNMTQPFLATGQVRWALNQVVQTDTPACNEYMLLLREKGFADAVTKPALAAAKSVAATVEALESNSPNPPPYPDVGVSMGMQQVSGNKMDSKQAPTFLSYGEDASGKRVYSADDDEEEKNEERATPSSALLPTPQVGRHVIPLKLGEVVDVILFNLPPETNQGPYDRPKDAPTNIEMHPM